MIKIGITLILIFTLNLHSSQIDACLGCHGKQFEKMALGTSKVVKDMSKENILKAIKGYKDGSYGGGMKVLMKGQVSNLSDTDIEAIASEIKNGGKVLTNVEIIKQDKIIPFGIELGKPLDKSITYENLSNSNIKMINNPPKPISLFITYAVSLNKTNKVTTVIGVGETKKNDEYCFNSKTTYTKVENILRKKYGIPSEQLDTLVRDSIWSESKYYKMSLVQNERYHITVWSSIASNENIEISLEEQATTEGCYIKIIYMNKHLNLKQAEEKEKSDLNSL